MKPDTSNKLAVDSQMCRCKTRVTTHRLIYTDLLLLLSVCQMQKSTSIDKNAAKEEPSHLH